MQKGLCIFALTISALVLVLFLADLIFGMAGMTQFAPFRYANFTIDVIFSICSFVVVILSFLTLREQH